VESLANPKANPFVHKQVNLTITTLQVVQMFAGLYINYKCLQLKVLGLPVDISYSTAAFSFVLYAIFAILFLNFFFWTYLFGPLQRSKSLLSSWWLKLGLVASSSSSVVTTNGTVASVDGGDINHNHYKGFVKKLQ